MPSTPPPSSPGTSSPLAEFVSRYGVLILVIIVGAIWLRQMLIPQELFASEDARVQFLASVGAPPSTRIITLVTEWCPACKQLDHTLSEEGIPHVRLDIEREPAGRELFQKVYEITGSNSIPKIILDRNIVSRPKLFLELKTAK
jgi:glutaredoxin